MPNLKAKNLKLIKLPFSKDGVSFLDIAKNDEISLIHTKSFNDEFFIAIKKKEDAYVIKAEKITRPSNLASIQKALEVFKQNFCENIVSEAFCYSDKKQVSNKFLKESEILEKIKSAKEIFIEIGFGSGRHLLFQAKNNPKILVIGLEIYKPSIIQVSKLGKKLDNLFISNCDARVFLSILPSNIIDKIFLHFPVPWDKAPHRRVITPEFVKEVKRVLKSGAKFELRTDSKMYFEFAKEKFSPLKNYEEFINKDLEISSKYEDRWKRMQKNIYDFIFINDSKVDKIDEKYSLKFLMHLFNPSIIYENFKNSTFKLDDCFIHFERIYKFSSDEILIRLSFGAFNYPQHCYIKISKWDAKYFIFLPLPSKLNYKAHNKIQEILYKWSHLQDR